MLNHLIKEYGTILIFIFVLSFLISFIFYFINGNKVSNLKKWILILLRTLVFSIIGFLLLNPSLKTIQNNTIKKKMVFLVDNSKSMENSDFELNKVNNLIQKVKEKFNEKLDFVEYGFDSEIIPLNKYNKQGAYTNLSTPLKSINNQFETNELEGVVLISDGIYNQSYHPKWINPELDFPIYTLGYGDSIQYSDLGIKYKKHNSITYLNNEFPVEIGIFTKAWKNKKVKLLIKNSQGQKVYEEKWDEPKSEDFRTISALLKSTKTGLNTYSIHLISGETEKNVKNNVATFTIDVLDVKNKILILNSEIHPDNHAIHQSIKSNIDYQVDQTSLKKAKNLDLKTYDCILFLGYQNETKPFLEKALELNKAFLLKLNSNSNLKQLQAQFPEEFSIKNKILDWELAQNSVNKNFKGFELDEKLKSFLKDTPPLLVPFSNIKTSRVNESILLQNVLKTTNKKGIVTIANRKESRFALIQGENFWKWRMYDYKTNSNFENFDNFFQSIIRLINVQKDKRLFYSEFPSVVNQNEDYRIPFKMYNESYEQISKANLSLNLIDEKGLRFDIPVNKLENSYESLINLDGLGKYNYKVINLSDNNKVLNSGTFEVIKNAIENQSDVANFGVLRHLSTSTGGQFYLSEHFTDLENKLLSLKIQEKVYPQTKKESLINKVWILISLLILGLLEWFLRRKFTLQ